MTGLGAFREQAAARLAAHPRSTVPVPPSTPESAPPSTPPEALAGAAPRMRRAAVVLAVTEHEGEPSVIVIKRAYRGRNAGQWGLPGGRVDDGETTEQAALRELHEELGLRVPESDIVGGLDDFPARSGFVITPLVAVLSAAGPPVPSPDEVHSVHYVPLRRLAAGDVARWVPQMAGGRLLQLRLGPQMVIHAPTGAILWQFREVVLLGRATRVADYLQPEWTHR